MVKKIALEEHFLCPGFEDYWEPTVGDVRRRSASSSEARLSDFGELRLRHGSRRHRAGGALARRSGVQAERDTAVRCRNAKAGQRLSRRGRSRSGPKRYSGFAHLAMQDGEGGCRRARALHEGTFKFCGVMINGHTNGLYLGDPSLNVFWERAEALGAPVYLHPTDRCTRPGARRSQGLRARDLGMDVRDRLARITARLRRRVRPLPAGSSCSGTGRDPASCSGVSTVAPVRASMG